MNTEVSLADQLRNKMEAVQLLERQVSHLLLQNTTLQNQIVQLEALRKKENSTRMLNDDEKDHCKECVQGKRTIYGNSATDCYIYK